jgi:hypothetical protein
MLLSLVDSGWHLCSPQLQAFPLPAAGLAGWERAGGAYSALFGMESNFRLQMDLSWYSLWDTTKYGLAAWSQSDTL